MRAQCLPDLELRVLTCDVFVTLSVVTNDAQGQIDDVTVRWNGGSSSRGRGTERCA